MYLSCMGGGRAGAGPYEKDEQEATQGRGHAIPMLWDVDLVGVDLLPVKGMCESTLLLLLPVLGTVFLFYIMFVLYTIQYNVGRLCYRLGTCG